MRLFLAGILLGLAAFVVAQKGQAPTGPLRSIRGGLARYQAPSGGFKNYPSDEHATAESTENALLLVSLFGLRTQINAYECSRYLTTLENSDGGYGNMPQRPSDIASVRNVILSFQHLGLPVQSEANVIAYIKTLKSSVGTFASRAGEKPDLQSTFYALQALELLGETRVIDEVAPLLKAYLADRATATHFEFEDEPLDLLMANYYGMMIAKAINWDIPNVQDWRSFLYRHTQLPESTLAGTAAGFICLNEIDPVHTAGSHIEQFFFAKESDGLRDAAAAYRAIALSADRANLIQTYVDFEVEDRNDDSFVQGTHIKPYLATRTSLGLEHPGLDVECLVAYQDEEPIALKLQWTQDARVYLPYSSYPTDNKLGPVSFDCQIRYYVASIGELSFPEKLIRHIGYGVVVKPEAEQSLIGRSIQVGEEVSVGTNFQLAVTLRNSTDVITQGNFDVVFDVLDASRVILHSESVSAGSSSGLGELVFKYSLTSSNILSGDLSLRVGVRETGSSIIHSSKMIRYTISTPMVASHLEFEGGKKEFMVGSDVVITMVPAAYDLQTLHPFSRFDARNADVSNQRQFIVDLVSAKKEVMFSAVGRPIQDGSEYVKYRFIIPVAPTLDFLGQNEVAFRYVTGGGQNVPLQNFNSRTNQLYNDASPFTFSVHSDLRMADVVEKPSPDADFFYGNDIMFQFKLQDAISERTITPSEKGFGNVYLTLQHESEDSRLSYVSVKEPASMEGDYFVINWAINPNAVSGEGTLIVAAEDAAGQSHTISDDGVPVRYSVKIGGNIDVDHQAFSSEVGGEAAFIVDFALTCNGKVLNDARLVSTVAVSKDGSLKTLARNAVATSAGRYQTSWTSKEVPTGTYILQFYRETDIARAQEVRALKERKLRTAKSSEDIEADVKPLFKVEIQHEAAPRAVLPVRTEVFVIGGLLLGWLAMLSQKS